MEEDDPPLVFKTFCTGLFQTHGIKISENEQKCQQKFQDIEILET